jgi:hypothetical protein
VTSLMRANARQRGLTNRFLGAEELAAWMRGREGAATSPDLPGVNRFGG